MDDAPPPTHSTCTGTPRTGTLSTAMYVVYVVYRKSKHKCPLPAQVRQRLILQKTSLLVPPQKTQPPTQQGAAAAAAQVQEGKGGPGSPTAGGGGGAAGGAQQQPQQRPQQHFLPMVQVRCRCVNTHAREASGNRRHLDQALPHMRFLTKHHTTEKLCSCACAEARPH